MGKLIQAVLLYGSSRYPVEANDTLPLPLEFDFNAPEECARKVLAVMSNASGGHKLANCRLRIHRGRKTASITCSGGYARYREDSTPFAFNVEQAMQFDAECEVYELGAVSTDQYGEGWKRARWTHGAGLVRHTSDIATR